MKTCSFCGNKNSHEKNVEYIYKHAGQMLFVNNVPCEECDFCGEQYFKAEVLKQIENDFNDIFISGKKPVRELRVPVEEFTLH